MAGRRVLRRRKLGRGFALMLGGCWRAGAVGPLDPSFRDTWALKSLASLAADPASDDAADLPKHSSQDFGAFRHSGVCNENEFRVCTRIEQDLFRGLETSQV